MKKSILVVTMILLLSLLVTTTAWAGKCPQLPEWKQVFDPVPIYGEGFFVPFAVEFKNHMYINGFYAENIDQDKVWGTKDGKNWTIAWEASSIQEGFEGIVSPMFVFKNQLYLVVVDWDEVEPARLVRTRDGKHWEEVAREEWAETYYTGFNGFASFQGMFYIVNTKWFVDEVTPPVVRLWRSPSGDAGTWEEVAQFPDWNIYWLGEWLPFETFKDALYIMSDVVVRDGALAPAEILRSFDGVNWEPVVTDGFGDPTNIRGGSFGQKSGYLYASMASEEATNAGDIYRTRDGVNWEPVTTNGLGDPEVLHFSSFVTYRDQLLAYGASETGCRVYASRDGHHWQLINDPGWGDSANIGVFRQYGRVIFKGNLYSGVMGPGGVYKLAKP
jgi:hypothetical protein